MLSCFGDRNAHSTCLGLLEDEGFKASNNYSDTKANIHKPQSDREESSEGSNFLCLLTDIPSANAFF
jgi:hypothetical protein